MCNESTMSNLIKHTFLLSNKRVGKSLYQNWLETQTELNAHDERMEAEFPIYAFWQASYQTLGFIAKGAELKLRGFSAIAIGDNTLFLPIGRFKAGKHFIALAAQRDELRRENPDYSDFLLAHFDIRNADVIGYSKRLKHEVIAYPTAGELHGHVLLNMPYIKGESKPVVDGFSRISGKECKALKKNIEHAVDGGAA